MKRILLTVLGLILCFAPRAEGQSAEHLLLLRISSLRGNLGLSPYVWNSQLALAAANHAQWLAQTGASSHRQSDGSLAADRARRFGYPGERVHENYFLGSAGGIGAAWNFWLNSAPHYNNLTSSLLSEIGIGKASAGGKTAYVLVFGHNAARGQAPPDGSAASGAAASGGQPAYILGLDELGNIRHEIQPGHTIGDIALIYGYTWDDIPQMLAHNDMTWDDIRLLQPGSEFLVPPKAGTYTPTSAAPTERATATTLPTTAATETPAATPSAKPSNSRIRAATLVIRLPLIATEAPKPQAQELADGAPSATAMAQLAILGAAILAQLGILAGAGIALWRRSR